MTTETALCPECLGSGGPDLEPCVKCGGEGVVPFIRHPLEAFSGRRCPPPGLIDIPENPTIHETPGLSQYLVDQLTRKS